MSSQRRCIRHIHNLFIKCQPTTIHHTSQYLIPSHSIFSSIQSPSHDITQLAYRHFAEKLKSQQIPSQPSSNPTINTSSPNSNQEIETNIETEPASDTDTTQVTIQHIEDHLTVIQWNNKKIFLLGVVHSSLTSAQVQYIRIFRKFLHSHP